MLALSPIFGHPANICTYFAISLEHTLNLTTLLYFSLPPPFLHGNRVSMDPFLKIPSTLQNPTDHYLDCYENGLKKQIRNSQSWGVKFDQLFAFTSRCIAFLSCPVFMLLFDFPCLTLFWLRAFSTKMSPFLGSAFMTDGASAISVHGRWCCAVSKTIER